MSMKLEKYKPMFYISDAFFFVGDFRSCGEI
jgi:hypothetical protein